MCTPASPHFYTTNKIIFKYSSIIFFYVISNLEPKNLSVMHITETAKFKTHSLQMSLFVSCLPFQFPISFAINFCGEEKVMQEMHQNASNEVLKSLNQEKSVEINYENMKVKLIKYC